jgi:hypothetical protein
MEVVSGWKASDSLWVNIFMVIFMVILYAIMSGEEEEMRLE